MSHVATVNIEVKDLDALKAACRALGLEFHEGQKTHRWFGRLIDDQQPDAAINPEDYGKCEHAIGLPNNKRAYEVGVVRRADGKPGFTLAYDNWGGGAGLEAVIGAGASKLRQHYAVQVATKQARRQGYRVQQQITADGKVRLLCQK